MQQGYCEGCKRNALLAPLHGDEKGGPLRCFICAGEWQAKHGQLRRLGRIVIRAMKAYQAAGGKWTDIEKLKMAASGREMFLGDAADPLAYMAGSAKIGEEMVDITSELLSDSIRLAHPDNHPPERQELATQVTQRLLALQPFVFPEPKPKPAPARATPRNGSTKVPAQNFEKPLRFPCVDCASTTPIECGVEIESKRKDARFCSNACRQSAHRKGSKCPALRRHETARGFLCSSGRRWSHGKRA